MTMQRMAKEDFSRMFRMDPSDLPERVVHLIGEYDLHYRPSQMKDLEEYVLNFLKLDENSKLSRTGEENRLAFERGWSENLDKLRQSHPGDYQLALKPGYFRGNRFFRYNNQLVVTDNHQLEYELFVIARLCIFHGWLAGARVICEFGCGTCANLLLLSEAMPEATLIGLDWAKASRHIASQLRENLSKPISGHVFNMLDPNHTLDIPEGAAMLSIHAFEQLGTRFDAVLDFIMSKRPSIVVQYEPVLEFYDRESLLDMLALRYCRKRGYLEGYYTKLRSLEEKGIIRILGAWRPYLGGVLHESSLIIWRPA
jgi:hypothetical protein